MAINFMPQIDSLVAIKLSVQSKVSGNHSLRFTELAGIEKYNIVLRDHYLKTSTPVKQGDSYRFNIDNSLAGTFGDDRFVLEIEASENAQRLAGSRVHVFPNPTEKILNVALLGSSLKKLRVSIYDLSGKLVKTEMQNTNSFELNVSDLSSGVYVLKIADGLTGKAISNSKFVKQ
jgi:hypothetical protein